MAQTVTARPPLQFGRGYRVSLTTTSGTHVTGQPVPIQGRNRLVVVEGSFVVKNAATDMTLEVAWTDPDGGAQTRYAYIVGTTTALDAYSAAVGTYGFTSGALLCEMGTTITITATAGTANNITVSAAPLGA